MLDMFFEGWRPQPGRPRRPGIYIAHAQRRPLSWQRRAVASVHDMWPMNPACDQKILCSDAQARAHTYAHLVHMYVYMCIHIYIHICTKLFVPMCGKVLRPARISPHVRTLLRWQSNAWCHEYPEWLNQYARSNAHAGSDVALAYNGLHVRPCSYSCGQHRSSVYITRSQSLEIGLGLLEFFGRRIEISRDHVLV